MTNGYVTDIMRNALGMEDAPENLVVMIVAYFEKK
jgi:type III secretory pathway component EscR